MSRAERRAVKEITSGAGDETRTRDSLLGKRLSAFETLKKLPTSQIADFTGFSRSYISQVKHGKKPPSQRLLEAIESSLQPKKPRLDHYELFLKSREAMGVSPKTMDFYHCRLGRFVKEYDYFKVTREGIEQYLNAIPPNVNGLATRHASYRALKTFFRWLELEYSIANPMQRIKAPILGKPILLLLELLSKVIIRQ